MKVSLFKTASNAGRPKPGQSIRGKISGPIPIPNPMDEEFPMRNPGTGIAVPLGPGGKEPQLQLQPPPEGSSTVSVSGPRPGVAQSNTDSVVLATGSSAASVLPDSFPRRMTGHSGTLRYSTVSASTVRSGDGKEVPQRKKSTLRHALGKLFGRKRRNGSQGTSSTERVSAVGVSGAHRSDPSALNRTATNKDGEPKRSASLPITEFDRALRSHSVGPEDITAIESARNSMVVDQALKTRRRAATTTSQIYAPLQGRDFGELGGLSPRPASTHGRSSKVPAGEEDPDEIGRAITSDAVGHRRRSRSLSGLNDTENGANVRRRSDEIRYWRESYDPTFMSPLSSNAPEGDDTGILDMELPGAKAEEKPPTTPPQPFNFGSLSQMRQMAGMKITHAVSLESRIESLEARMRRMERVVTQLCNKVPGFRVPTDPLERSAPEGPASDPSFAFTAVTTSTAPGMTAAIYSTAPPDVRASSPYGGSRRSESSHSHTSFGDAPTYVGSLHPSTALGPAPAHHRPSSNVTVRGATSLPALPRDPAGPLAADNYSALLALVETERAARLALEAQVRALAQQLGIAALPLPAASRPEQNPLLDPPPTAKSFGQASAFDHDEDDDEEGDDVDDDEGDAKTPEVRAGAVAEAKARAVQLEDSGIATGGGGEDEGRGEEAYSEGAATPREDRTFGAFGEELRHDDGDGRRKKAARTLSLSQLTVGKPQPVAQE